LKSNANGPGKMPVTQISPLGAVTSTAVLSAEGAPAHSNETPTPRPLVLSRTSSRKCGSVLEFRNVPLATHKNDAWRQRARSRIRDALLQPELAAACQAREFRHQRSRRMCPFPVGLPYRVDRDGKRFDQHSIPIREPAGRTWQHAAGTAANSAKQQQQRASTAIQVKG
jgi:hypothetical protein